MDKPEKDYPYSPPAYEDLDPLDVYEEYEDIDFKLEHNINIHNLWRY